MSVMSPVQIQPRVSDFISKPRKMMINGQWVDSIQVKLFLRMIPPPAKCWRKLPKVLQKTSALQ